MIPGVEQGRIRVFLLTREIGDWSFNVPTPQFMGLSAPYHVKAFLGYALRYQA